MPIGVLQCCHLLTPDQKATCNIYIKSTFQISKPMKSSQILSILFTFIGQAFRRNEAINAPLPADGRSDLRRATRGQER